MTSFKKEVCGLLYEMLVVFQRKEYGLHTLKKGLYDKQWYAQRLAIMIWSYDLYQRDYV